MKGDRTIHSITVEAGWHNKRFEGGHDADPARPTPLRPDSSRLEFVSASVVS
jgi:hypothetical protein